MALDPVHDAVDLVEVAVDLVEAPVHAIEALGEDLAQLREVLVKLTFDRHQDLFLVVCHFRRSMAASAFAIISSSVCRICQSCQLMTRTMTSVTTFMASCKRSSARRVIVSSLRGGTRGHPRVVLALHCGDGLKHRVESGVHLLAQQVVALVDLVEAPDDQRQRLRVFGGDLVESLLEADLGPVEAGQHLVPERGEGRPHLDAHALHRPVQYPDLGRQVGDPLAEKLYVNVVRHRLLLLERGRPKTPPASLSYGSHQVASFPMPSISLATGQFVWTTVPSESHFFELNFSKYSGIFSPFTLPSRFPNLVTIQAALRGLIAVAFGNLWSSSLSRRASVILAIV